MTRYWLFGKTEMRYLSIWHGYFLFGKTEADLRKVGNWAGAPRSGSREGFRRVFRARTGGASGGREAAGASGAGPGAKNSEETLATGAERVGAQVTTFRKAAGV